MMQTRNTLRTVGTLVIALAWSGLALGDWSTSAMSGDGDSGVSTSETYTHAMVITPNGAYGMQGTVTIAKGTVFTVH